MQIELCGYHLILILLLFQHSRQSSIKKGVLRRKDSKEGGQDEAEASEPGEKWHLNTRRGREIC